MENTLENKAKFFALYWGQRVMKQDYPTLGSFTYEPDGFIRSMSNEYYLQLKPLSSISDEDAYLLSITNQKLSIDGRFIFNGKDSAIRYIKNNINLSISNDRYNSEFLRSKGYALPWMGKSVEDQVKDGWIKLKHK